MVFVAMIIVGVFITEQFKDYYLDKVTTELTNTTKNAIEKFLPKENLYQQREDIKKNLANLSVAMNYQIIIIDTKKDFKIVATTNSQVLNQDTLEYLNEGLLMKAADGKLAQKDLQALNSDYTSRHIVFPYKNEKGQTIGVIYCMANLDSIYKILDNSQWILLKATFLAIAISVILGFLIATSITNPINTLTAKALDMAKGDFDQVVDIKSDDEIGQLGKMFNYLTAKLKETLAQIYSEKSKLDAIINHMADGLIAVDKTGRVLHVNPRFNKMLSLMICENDDYDEIIKSINPNLCINNIRKKREVFGQELIELENGSILKAKYTVLKDEKEKSNGIVVVIQDITESQKLENLRKDFIANVSHELKTPITTIKSYTETLIDGALENEDLAKNFLNVINNESDRMTRLVKDLLQISRLDHQKSQTIKEPVSLNALLQEVCSKLDIACKEKGHKMQLNITNQEIFVLANKDEIEQVIQNLISNSIKYTPQNGQIDVSMSINNQIATIDIKDDGVGIPKNDLDRIFERFYRVDKARSRDMGGTGLGLSIAKNIIELYGGDIQVKSEVDKGSVFTVKLPVQTSIE